MGVTNLTSFMKSRQGKNYYVPCKLSSSYVIIDGALYLELYGKSNDDPRFGGDCKKMYDVTYKTFKRFLDCDITPIVVMGGIPDEKTEKLRAESREARAISDFKTYNVKGFKLPDKWRVSVIFRASAFYEALNDLGIFYCRCDFGKEGEIVELASKLNCPVISKSSEFFLYNGIRFIYWDTVKYKDDTNKDYIDCLEFDREKLMKDFEITPMHLPYLAMLFPSDHSKRNLARALISRSHGKPGNKMLSALKWLQYETVESAEKKFLKSIPKREVIKKELDETVKAYTETSTSLGQVIQKRFHFKDVEFNVKQEDLAQKFNVPPDVMELVRTCKIPITVLETYLFHSYTFRTALEDACQLSVNYYSIPLLQGIYGLLMKNEEEKPPLKIKIREGAQLVTLEKEATPISNCFLNQKNKKVILLQIMNIDAALYDSVLKFFDEGWVMFILALIYFAREGKAVIEENHLHSIILTAVILHIIDRYGSNEECEKIEEVETLADHFKNLEKEKLTDFIKKSMKLNIRKSDRVVLNSISNIHMYLTFQSCLIFSKHIFRLLRLPYGIKPSRFISGSIFYSVSKAMKESGKSEVDWVKDWFEENDQLWELYLAILANMNNSDG